MADPGRSFKHFATEPAIVAMLTTGQKTAAEVARLFNIHPATVSRWLALQSEGVKI